MARRFVWLETGGTIATHPALIVCHSLANACHLGKPGDSIYLFCSECERCAAGDRCGRMAAKPAYRIVANRWTDRKRAVRLIYPR